MTKSAVIFARGKEIQGQIEHCRKYAEERGISVAGVIVAQGRELPEIIKGVQADIDLVLVKCMSRISRNALECYTIQADLELGCGASVKVAKDEKKEEAAERFMQNVIAAVNECKTRQRV